MKISAKYKYVYDVDGNVISISSVTKENRQPEYYSIGSHTPMIAALGDVNQHHFKCKKGYQINPETELHQYAKKMLKYRFDMQEHFEVRYYKTKRCRLCESCIFKDQYSPCDILEEELYVVDLKQWYDTATIEKLHNGFIADVLLTNSVMPNRKPVFIEVNVSHPCDKRKIEAGNKIIEIKVQKEEDAYCEIIQSSDYASTYSYGMNTDVQFYNFKNEDVIDDCQHYSNQMIFSGQTPIVRTTQRGVATKYYCVPEVSNNHNPLHTYIKHLKVGMLFASNSYAAPFVFDKALSLDAKSLIILGKDIYGAVKPWVVYKVYFVNGHFEHRYISGHFDYFSALRDFTISQGKTWTGGWVFSDECE